MLPFDSDEYWQRAHWDRTSAVAKAQDGVRQEWLYQEESTLTAIADLAAEKPALLRILDLPCGTGRLSRLILDRCGESVRVTGADLNKETLAAAAKTVGASPRWNALHCNAYSVGALLPGQVDVVISLDFLHHVSELKRFADAVCLALAPGGHFVGNAFAFDTYEQWDVLKYGRVVSLWRSVRHRAGITLHTYLPPARSFVRRAGLSRIAPLTESDLRQALESSFQNRTLHARLLLLVRCCEEIASGPEWHLLKRNLLY